jgi:hypothetical protein
VDKHRRRTDIIAIHSFSALVSARLDNPTRGSRACEGARGSWGAVAAAGPSGRRTHSPRHITSCRRLCLPLPCSRVRLHCIAFALGLSWLGIAVVILAYPLRQS